MHNFTFTLNRAKMQTFTV